MKQEAAAGGKPGTGRAYNEGDVVTPKINNVKLLAQAKAGSRRQLGNELGQHVPTRLSQAWLAHLGLPA